MEPHLNPQLMRTATAYSRLAEATRPTEKPNGPPPPQLQLPDRTQNLSHVYNPSGSVNKSSPASGNLLSSYRKARSEIGRQVSYLSRQYQIRAEYDNAAAEPQGAAKFAATQGKSTAELTEYWNRENTAQRIFDIALLGYEKGLDRQEFAQKAIAIVEQAYIDVGSVIGIEFPDVVLETRKSVLDALEQFSEGVARDQISF